MTSIEELNKIAKRYFTECLYESFTESIKELELELELLKKEEAMSCKGGKPKVPKPKK